MTGVVEKWFGMSWETWVTDLRVSSKIESFIDGVGWFYLACAIFCIFVNTRRKWMRYPIILGALSLLTLAVLYFIEKGFVLAQLFEYSTQVFAPIALLWSLSANNAEDLSSRLIIGLKIAIALTFLGHGLYAMGVFPVPGNFVYMLSSVFGIGDSTAKTILLVAGFLDIFAIVGLFLPRLKRISLIYCIIWGLATSMARIITGFTPMDPMGSMSQWLHETVMRLPHGLLPLALFLALGYTLNKSKKLTPQSP